MKRLMILTILTFLIIPSVTSAAYLLEFLDDWDTEDKIMLGTYTLVWAVDLGQTRYIAKHPDEYYEDVSAWAIGEHPSVSTVNNYFVGQYILWVFLANQFPELRKPLLGFLTISHISCIDNNISIGIKIDL